MKKGDELDPRGLIFESYRIEGITDAECRSIFVDWALGMPLEADMRGTIDALLARYGAEYPDHPMTVVLRDGLAEPSRRGRRGGRAGRRTG